MKIKKSVLLDALKVLGKVVSQTSPVEVQRSARFQVPDIQHLTRQQCSDQIDEWRAA